MLPGLMAAMNPDKISSSLREMDRVFETAFFNDEAKFKRLCNALSKLLEMLQFFIFKTDYTQKELSNVVLELEGLPPPLS